MFRTKVNLHAHSSSIHYVKSCKRTKMTKRFRNNSPLKTLSFRIGVFIEVLSSDLDVPVGRIKRLTASIGDRPKPSYLINNLKYVNTYYYRYGFAVLRIDNLRISDLKDRRKGAFSIYYSNRQLLNIENGWFSICDHYSLVPWIFTTEKSFQEWFNVDAAFLRRRVCLFMFSNTQVSA